MARLPLPPREVHHRSVGRAAVRAGALLAGVLAIGAGGLLLTNGENLANGGHPVVDAVFGAAMIMTGMGPAPDVELTVAAKLFLTGYSIFSGVGFLGVMGLLFQPVFHRFLHRFHLELDPRDD